MEGLKSWYSYFREYEHVAKFQKLCGVKVTRFEHQTVSDNDAMCTCQTLKGKDLTRRSHLCEEDKQSMEVPVQTQNGSDKSVDTKTKIEIQNYFLYYLFNFGASLGSELFYLTFYPFTLWNIDSRLCRQLVLIWHILMYFGQLAKDFIKWPRPGPPAVKLEERFEMEYGMPSTHTIVGTCIPFSLLILTSNAYEYPFILGLLGAIAWTSLVAFSRVYLGMHTALDVLAGITMTAMFLPFLLGIVEYLDYLQVTHPYAPVFTFLLPLLACHYYPKQKVWSITRGDTANIMSIGSGVAMGAWLNYQLGWMTELPKAQGLQPLPVPTLDWALYSALRVIIGVAALAMSRKILKKFYFKIIVKWTGVDKDDIMTQREMGLEVPHRWMTLFSISIMTSFMAPVAYSFLGINRDGYYHEVGY